MALENLEKTDSPWPSPGVPGVAMLKLLASYRPELPSLSMAGAVIVRRHFWYNLYRRVPSSLLWG